MRSWLYFLFLIIFVPLSIFLYFNHANPLLTGVLTLLAIIPITNLIAKATHELSLRTSTAMSSLVNATFGNSIEFMIAIFAIRAGLVEMVKASIIGSIVLNILLLIGLSMLFGGLQFREQTYNRDSVGVGSTMLLIAVAGLALPSIYTLVTGKSVVLMSQAVSITLALTYLFSLVFVLFSHRYLFVTNLDIKEEPGLGLWEAIIVLIVGMALAAIESNLLVGVIKPILATTALSETFTGLVVVAVVTNIPENVTAIRYALRDNITLSLEIGMNSAIQIALFVAPVLVFASPLLGAEMTLAFPAFQVMAIILSVMIFNYVGNGGACNWLEGLQLVAVYMLIAIAFYFV